MDVATICEEKDGVHSIVVHPIFPVIVGVVGDRFRVRGSLDGVAAERVDR